MPDRKQQILDTAIKIIAAQGYARLTMRSLARASGLKLGALQYHFRTWEALQKALATYIEEAYRSYFDDLAADNAGLSLRDTIEFFFSDAAGRPLHADRLWPQLWAMAQVEPVMKELLDNIYRKYLQILEQKLTAAGSQTPRAEALGLMSLVEGSTLFVGSESVWAEDFQIVRDTLLTSIDNRYGRPSGQAFVQTQHNPTEVE